MSSVPLAFYKDEDLLCECVVLRSLIKYFFVIIKVNILKFNVSYDATFSSSNMFAVDALAYSISLVTYETHFRYSL